MSRLYILLGLLFIAGIVSAGCAEDAYLKACSSCPFDENGKMDKSCYESYQQSGISCIAASYPIAAAKHAKGECPQIDTCSEKLRECISAYPGSDFTDKEKCEGGMSTCFKEADLCVHKAAVKCGEEIPSPCQSSFILIFLVLTVFIRNASRK